MGSGFLFLLSSRYKNLFPAAPTFLPENYPNLENRVAFITGANSGVGYESAKLLASKNCFVLLGVRNISKGNAAIEKLRKDLGDNNGNSIGRLELVEIDLSDLNTITNAVDQIRAKTDKLNLIIHNAGVMNPPIGSKSKQGYELQLGTNVVGPYLLQKKLDPFFIGCDTDFKRIVWLTSSSHLTSPPSGGIQWDDINFIKNEQESALAYGQSKLANIYLSNMWSKFNSDQVQRQNIVSLAVHPGILRTQLFDNYPKFQMKLLNRFLYPPVYGAYTEMFAALSPQLSYKDNGKYVIPWGQIGNLRDDIEKGIHDGIAEKLWNWLESETSNYV